jgi:hypothetical protein
MGNFTREIAFDGQLGNGQLAGLGFVPWQEVITELQLTVDGSAPVGGPLTVQLLVDGVAQTPTISVPAGENFIDLDISATPITVIAGATRQGQIVAANGASYATLTLIGTTTPNTTANPNGTTTINVYLTEADCELAWTDDVLTQILDDPVNPTGDLNTALMDQLIGRVTGMMNEAFSFRYAIPLVVPTSDADNVAETLRNRALALFFWLAIKDKTRIQEAYKGSKSEYDDAVVFLHEAKEGKAYLGTSATLPGSPARLDGTITSGHRGTFDRESMRGW